jgi:phenylacetate-CoA ligase
VPAKRLESLYGALPEWGQTLALNAYGLRNRERLRRWNRTLACLSGTECLAPDLQVPLVARRLRQVVGHALRYVPRYAGLRNLARELGGPDAAVFEILRELPVITKDEIAADHRAFLSTELRGTHLVRTVTSGTTGTPFATLLEPEAALVGDAMRWRCAAWAGFSDGDWIARLVGDPAVPLSHSNPIRPFRVSWTDRRLYLSTYHLSGATAPAMVRELERRGPAFVMGYPSALVAMAELAKRPPIAWRPRAVLYSSEPLYEHQRAVIEEFFSAPIRGFYGCAERVVSAVECEHGNYHLGLVDGYVEGQFGGSPFDGPAPVTGLLNRAMPLVRYDLGDNIVPRPGVVCGCGRTLPLISAVVTKREDAVVTPSGRVVSPSILTWAFKDVPGLHRAQVVQRPDASIEVRVVADASFVEASAAALEQHVRRLVFGEIPVSVVRVSKLDLTKAGKTRFVVSQYSRAGQSEHGSI